VRPSSRAIVLAIALLVPVSVGLQAVRDAARPPGAPPASLMWIQSPSLARRLSLGFDALVADVYWMRAVIYYGGQRLAEGGDRRYEQLWPLLDLVTGLDPRFRVAYRFGAIFLTEGYPSGPARPDLAIRLLQKGLAYDPARWEYVHDIGFVHYWWLHDYQQAAAWFEKAGQVPGAPEWLPSMAATTLAMGGNRQSSRALWTRLLDSSDTAWIRRAAERSLAQLDALDVVDQLNAVAGRFAAREGRAAATWDDLVRGERLPGIPLDSTGTPFVLDPQTGRVGLSPESPLWPLPPEPIRRGPDGSPVTGMSPS
jgi:hypothetical protein